MKKIKLLAACAALAVAGTALAQNVVAPAPQNVLQLTASGTVEVQQDLLSMTLSTTREATDAATVQSQLKAALDAALTEAKKSAQPGQLDVRTGNFSLSPRYTKDGKINGWQGSSELVLEGRDFPRITQAAGRITTLTVANVGFGLSSAPGPRPRRKPPPSKTSSRRPANWPRASVSAATRCARCR